MLNHRRRVVPWHERVLEHASSAFVFRLSMLDEPMLATVELLLRTDFRFCLPTELGALLLSFSITGRTVPRSF